MASDGNRKPQRCQGAVSPQKWRSELSFRYSLCIPICRHTRSFSASRVRRCGWLPASAVRFRECLRGERPDGARLSMVILRCASMKSGPIRRGSLESKRPRCPHKTSSEMKNATQNIGWLFSLHFRLVSVLARTRDLQEPDKLFLFRETR